MCSNSSAYTHPLQSFNSLFRNLQIHDWYEFDEVLDLDVGGGKYLSPDADRSVRNKYRLHSVLVHSGTVNSGHYRAFICPNGRQWYLFDDTKVLIISRVFM